jgi:hypothetical protein
LLSEIRNLFVIQIKFKPERGARIAREFETSQRRDRINTSLQRKNLKASAEHFRMQQRLQRAICFRRGADFR